MLRRRGFTDLGDEPIAPMIDPNDRLKQDYDLVENLDDLIEAREERTSAFADGTDAVEDIDLEHLPFDEEKELTRPHRHKPSEEEKLGIDVELLDTPNEREVEFDWQDSAEEMLPTDPDPDEGMGADAEIESLAHVGPTDLVGPVPSVEPGSETDTAATPEELEELGRNGGEPVCPPPMPTPIESAMDTDSDEEDYSISDKFAGEVDREAALETLEDIRIAIEEEEG